MTSMKINKLIKDILNKQFKGGDNMIQNKCKDCQVRYIGCHGKCKSYLEYRADRELINKNRQKGQLYMDYITHRSRAINR